MGHSASKAVPDSIAKTLGGEPAEQRDAGGKRPVEQRGSCYVHSNAVAAVKDLDLPPPSDPSQFDILAVLGRGCFGKVCLVRRKGGRCVYAMKSLNKDFLIQHSQVEHTRAERLILGTIRHPFIVRLDYAFQTRKKLFMVLEVINGGELFYHLKKEGHFSEDRVRFYAAEIVLALEYLHSRDIIYRDLKPENILLDSEGHVVLTDFGLSKVKAGGRTSTLCGTPEYLAPEIIREVGHGPAVDWWSLGTVMYELIVGLPPFYSQNVDEMYRRILGAPLSLPAYMSPEARTLLTGMLERDPAKRLGSGSRGATDIKCHPFFSGIDWSLVYHRSYRPPFVPKVREATDLTYVADEFRDEVAAESPCTSGSTVLAPETTTSVPTVPSVENMFAGFTYAGSVFDTGLFGTKPQSPLLTGSTTQLDDDSSIALE